MYEYEQGILKAIIRKNGLTAPVTNISHALSDEMIRHGFLMATFIALSGVFSYAYQLVMGMMLSAEQYGILFSLTSLLVILQVFSQTVTMVVARFTSRMKTEGQLQGLSFLWQRSLRGNLFISLAGFAVLAALSPLVARFLHLDNIWYPLILFTSILFLLLISVNWGVLQGLQRFLPFGVSQAATYLVRLIFGALFVYAGWGIYGGLAAVTLSLAVVLPLTFVPLRDLPEAGNKKVAIEGMQAYAGLTLLALITLTSMANLDAILARHYLTAVEAGNYSALSVLGRIAYYAPLGIGIAMFPKTSELYDCGGNYRRPFYKAALLTLLIAGAIVLVYLFFPQAITGLLFGQKYPLVAPYLFEYGVAMVLLVAAFLLANYFLSLKRTSIVYSLLAVTILQIGLIAVYHAEISQLVHIMLASGVLCILVMLPPFFRRAS